MAEKQVFHFIYRPPVNQELLALREKYEKIRPSTLEWLRSMKRKFKARIEVIRMNNNDQEFLVQKIRTQYAEKQPSALEELKALDVRVKRPAYIFAYIYGVVSAIIMGAGMSLVMTDMGAILGIAHAMVPGIVIGTLGLVLALTTYPIYKRILNSRKKKYATQILELSDKLLVK